MRRGSPGRGKGAGGLCMKKPEWRAGPPGGKLPPKIQARREVFAAVVTGKSRLRFAAVTSPITARLIARSHGVADPRWSPSGNRLAWADSFNGRSDLVITASDGSSRRRRRPSAGSVPAVLGR